MCLCVHICIHVYTNVYKCVSVSVCTHACNHVCMCVHACMSVPVLHVSTHQAIAGKHQRGVLLEYLSQDHWSTSYVWKETNLRET